MRERERGCLTGPSTDRDPFPGHMTPTLLPSFVQATDTNQSCVAVVCCVVRKGESEKREREREKERKREKNRERKHE